MPLFPNTRNYLYLFYTSDGTAASLKVTIVDSTPVRKNETVFRRPGVPAMKNNLYTISGRRVEMSLKTVPGVIAGRKMLLVNFNDFKASRIESKK